VLIPLNPAIKQSGRSLDGTESADYPLSVATESQLPPWSHAMETRTILTTLPGSSHGQRLEVALTPGRDGRLVIELREQHYAEGIGWFDQRALTLEPAQFKRLQAALALKTTGDAAVELDAPPMILPFPGPPEVEPRRKAVGSEV
jgi:hypothetical protein